MRLLVGFFVGLLLLNSQVSYGETQQQVEARMQQLQSDIGSLQAWLDEAQSKASNIQQQLRKNNQAISTLSKAIKENQDTAAQAQDLLAKLQLQSSRFQDVLAEQEQQLGAQLRRQYQQGQNFTSQVLLSLDDPRAVARNMAYYQYLNQDSAEQMASYRQTLDALILVQQEQADIALELKLAKQQLLAQNEDLQRAKTQLAQNLKELNLKKGTQSERLATAKADQKQAQDLLEQIQIAISKANIQREGMLITQAKGSLDWPLRGKVLNKFGVAQSNFPLSQQGWLIAAPEGSDVVAVFDGQVVFSDWLKGYGLVIIIDHGDGFLSLYGQNQALFLSTGDKVSAQQLIASSGRSGGNSMAALYFSLRQNGTPLNPKNWLE